MTLRTATLRSRFRKLYSRELSPGNSRESYLRTRGGILREALFEGPPTNTRPKGGPLTVDGNLSALPRVSLVALKPDLLLIVSELTFSRTNDGLVYQAACAFGRSCAENCGRYIRRLMYGRDVNF